MSDLLRKNLDVVFCGTAKGTESARTNTYYAKSGNKFWDILHEAAFTDRRISPHAYRDLLAYGIGLTDLNTVDSGMDHEISMGNCDIPAFKRKMLKFRPRIIAFTGKGAAEIYLDRKVDYGEQAERLGEIRIFVLTSTSGMAQRYWDPKYWFELRKQY